MYILKIKINVGAIPELFHFFVMKLPSFFILFEYHIEIEQKVDEINVEVISLNQNWTYLSMEQRWMDYYIKLCIILYNIGCIIWEESLDYEFYTNIYILFYRLLEKYLVYRSMFMMWRMNCGVK